MKKLMKHYHFLTAFWVIVLMLGPARVFAGTMTLTTYYPAPHGHYAKLQLVPMGSNPGTPCQPGTMYVDNSSGISLMKFCNDSGAWGNVLSYTPQQGDGSNQVATTQYVDAATAKSKCFSNYVLNQCYVSYLCYNGGSCYINNGSELIPAPCCPTGSTMEQDEGTGLVCFGSALPTFIPPSLTVVANMCGASSSLYVEGLLCCK